MKTKRNMALGMALGMLALAGCGEGGFDQESEIGLVSREDGSGTRAAFTELAGIMRKEPNGKKVDHTTPETMVAGSTAVALTTVANDPAALGYVSLGSINDSVKTLLVEGVAPTGENIDAGKYKLVHPFNVVTKRDRALTPAAKDFLAFVLSPAGQAIVARAGYLKVQAKPYAPNATISGKVVCSGSSSVTPCMEKLQEAYMKDHPNVKVEVQQSDSSTGVADAREGVCDLGMASRALKDSEKAAGLEATAIALDGLAVIVNPKNPTVDISLATLRKAFEGQLKTWAEVAGE